MERAFYPKSGARKNANLSQLERRFGEGIKLQEGAA